MRLNEKKSQPIRLSIIVPIHHEGSNLFDFLKQNEFHEADEIIIVDSSYSPELEKFCNTFNKLTYSVANAANRAIQMNQGANLATCDGLLFLHADTHLPAGACQAIKRTLQNNHLCGCFKRHFTPNSPLLRVTSWLAYWRTKACFLAYGDQSIFIQSQLFHQIGGYQPLLQLEDLDLCIRAKKHTRPQTLNLPIQTSARRFSKACISRLLKDALMSCAFTLRLYSPRRFHADAHEKPLQ
ncbi:glycosyltransferase [Rubritalea tangerina]|uniref:Glycosyltransferase n=1 Tax=Rubritalea tangerina TaxID=430798 RepID=A0ABW4Z9V4_9BACT